MSIGNTKEYGNKGNNFPYQLKSLQGLQCACDQLIEVVTNTTNIMAHLGPATRTPSILRVTNTVGTIAINVNSISFSNVGTANATVNGVVLKQGETINFDAGSLNNYFIAGSFSYDTTTSGAELLITYTS